MTAGSTAAPRDRGLQPERNALAWQRAALAVAGGSAVMARLTFEVAGPFALVVMGVGVLHAAVIVVTSGRQYRRPVSPRIHRLWPAGIHAALLAGQVALLAVLGLVDVLARR